MAKKPTDPIIDAIPAASAHSTFLFFTGNGSDKVYQVHLRAKADGWVVDYANGPRGGALTQGTKTKNTVLPWSDAHKIYAGVVAEKTRGGYTREQSGAIYTSAEHAGRVSGEQPMLPTAITAEQARSLMDDPQWGLQLKADGENRILVVEGTELKGTNRRGLYVDIPVAWSAPHSDGRTVICGEHVGDRFKAFDLLEFMGKDLRAQPYRDRFHQLGQITARGMPWLDLLELACTPAAKRDAARAIEAAQGEGYVLKRLDAPFEAGRSIATLKVRFWESATCLVTRQNLKSSVGVGLRDATGAMVDLGNVTIPANVRTPAIGDLIEVRYLYRHHEGKFEMPTFQRVRTDLLEDAATLTQITRIKNRGAEVPVASDELADDTESEGEHPRG